MIAVTVPRDRFELPLAFAVCNCCKAAHGPVVECSMPSRCGGHTSFADHQLAEQVSGFFRHLAPARSDKGQEIHLLCRACARHLHALASSPVEGERPDQKLEREWLALRLGAYLGLPVPTCSKCQAPAMGCRDCGVLLCEDHGREHDPPDCPVAFKELLREQGAGVGWAPFSFEESRDEARARMAQEPEL